MSRATAVRWKSQDSNPDQPDQVWSPSTILIHGFSHFTSGRPETEEAPGPVKVVISTENDGSETLIQETGGKCRSRLILK